MSSEPILYEPMRHVHKNQGKAYRWYVLAIFPKGCDPSHRVEVKGLNKVKAEKIALVLNRLHGITPPKKAKIRSWNRKK
jgi:hypothetical protein